MHKLINTGSNEKGTILITMLILMVIVTIIGIIAVNTSTVDIQISGNVKRATMAFEGAEAGVDLSVSVIENTIATGALTPAGAVPIGVITTLDTANLEAEVMGDSDNNTDTPSASPDIGMSDIAGGVSVNVDIDRLYAYALAGGSLEFAAGYEGVGAGAGGGGTASLYSIDSQGTK